MKTEEYQLQPILAHGNKLEWSVVVKRNEYWQSVTVCRTIKEGRAIVAHLKREPIKL